jgi:hypothetical protein
MRLRLFGLSLLVPLALAPACGSDDEGGGGGTGGDDSGAGGATAGSGGTGTGGGTSGTGGGTSGTGGGTSGAGGTTPMTDAEPPPPPPPTACEQLTAGCASATGDGGAGCLATGEDGDETACEAALEGCADTCGAAVCAELRDLCGPVDPGRGRIHNCFTAGEDDNAAACFERADCIEICTQAQADAGGGDGGGLPDGSAEAGPQDAAADGG